MCVITKVSVSEVWIGIQQSKRNVHDVKPSYQLKKLKKLSKSYQLFPLSKKPL